MYGWLTFYHQVIARSFQWYVKKNSFWYKGHEVAKDFKPYMTDLQIRVQNVRCLFSQELSVLLPSPAFSWLEKTCQFLFPADPGKLQGEPRWHPVPDAQDARGAPDGEITIMFIGQGSIFCCCWKWINFLVFSNKLRQLWKFQWKLVAGEIVIWKFGPNYDLEVDDLEKN